MNYLQKIKPSARFFRKTAVFGMMGAAGLLFATSNVSGQTTNAYDVASDPAYAGTGAGGSGLLPGGQNGGYGFGAWAFIVNATGGAFTSTTGPSGASWDLWNTTANGSTVAVRPFSSALVPGQSFSVQLRLNSLDRSYTTNTLMLQDASGNTLFSYYHTGYEPNGAVDGSYTDASTSQGAAIGFSYNYQQFSTFTFTLNSSTTYTFTDNTTGHSFTGVLSGAPIAQVAFVRGNGNPDNPPNGQDFQIDQLAIVSSAPPSFGLQTPTPGAYSAFRTNVSVQVIAGGTPINTDTISLKVDGSAVTPTVVTSLGITTISYAPVSPLSPGVMHSAEVSVADNNNGLFTNSWTFTTGFPSLPAILPGPFATSNGNDILIFTTAGDDWVGTNYGANSSSTLYTRFSMTFHDVNGETGAGGCFGGVDFYQGNVEKLIIGNSWLSTSWSLDGQFGAGQQDLYGPAVVIDEWHTIVIRTDYAPGAYAQSKIWFDPDFSLPEASQANPPLEITTDVTFDNIRLRCGNGTANAEWTNIMVAALGTGVGFAPPVDPILQGFVPGANSTSASPSSPVGFQIVEGGVNIEDSAIHLSLDGNAVTPVISRSGSIITISYQPSAPFDLGSTHSVSANFTDVNGTPYGNDWSFTVDIYPSLPVTLAGPYDVNGGNDLTLCTSLNGWIDGHYGATSTNTLYARVSMSFTDLNGKTGSGGAYGGLHFFQDNAERLLVGDSWTLMNWSVDAKESGEMSLVPATTVAINEWHTMVARIDYAASANAKVKVWLDPDFSKSEGSQAQAPLTFSMNNTFNNLRLRCGNGTADAQFTNIVLAATATGVGFAPAPAGPAVLSINNLGGGSARLSWTGAGTLQEASAINGTWADSASQANPQTVSVVSSALFFRVKQ